MFPDADAVLYAGWCLDTGYIQSFETVGSGTGLTRLYECDFDTAAVKNYYNGMSGVYHSNRTEYTNYGVTVKLADDGETHSGATAMRLAYTLPANSMEAKYLGAFRITGQEGERITVSAERPTVSASGIRCRSCRRAPPAPCVFTADRSTGRAM